MRYHRSLGTVRLCHAAHHHAGWQAAAQHQRPGGQEDAQREDERDSAEDRDTPSDFFPRLAAHWKHAYTSHPAGWTAWILSPDMRLPSAMRLKESRRVPLWNGPIECRLFRFDLVAGSARGPRTAAAEAG